MSSFLQHLAARNAGVLDIVRPRPNAFFEPLTRAAWPAMPHEDEVAAPQGPPPAAPANSAAAVAPPGPPEPAIRPRPVATRPPGEVDAPRASDPTGRQEPAKRSAPRLTPPPVPANAGRAVVGPARPPDEASPTPSPLDGALIDAPRRRIPTLQPARPALESSAPAPRDPVGSRLAIRDETLASLRPVAPARLNALALRAADAPGEAVRPAGRRPPSGAIAPPAQSGAAPVVSRSISPEELNLAPPRAPLVETADQTLAQLRARLGELRLELWRAARPEWPGRAGADPAAAAPAERPAIHVHIGRIEVRATPAPAAPRKAPPPATPTPDDYLRRRNGGGGPA